MLEGEKRTEKGIQEDKWIQAGFYTSSDKQIQPYHSIHPTGTGHPMGTGFSMSQKHKKHES